MSLKVVGYGGTGKRRHPLYKDEGEASASGHGIGTAAQVARLSTVVPSQLRGVGASAPVGGAGRVERSQATAAQREAWRSEPKAASPIAKVTVDRPALNSPEHLQASRMRGAQRHVEVMANRQVHPPDPPLEEPVMVEAAPPPTFMPNEGAMTDEAAAKPAAAATAEPLGDSLAVLVDAAQVAHEAWEQRVDADANWASARAALEASWVAIWGSTEWIGPAAVALLAERVELAAGLGRAVGRLEGSGLEPADLAAIDQAEEELASLAERRHEDLLHAPTVAPTQVVELVKAGADYAEASPAERDRRRYEAELAAAADLEAQRTTKAGVKGPAGRPLTTNEQRVLAATIRHGGDRKAAARELGISNENVQATLTRVGVKGQLPQTLIDRLPAAFAKFSGVPA